MKNINISTSLPMEEIAEFFNSSSRVEDAKNFLNDNNINILRLSLKPRTLDFIKNLEEVLKTNKTVEELFLSGCDINDQGAYCLAKMLTLNNSIKFLTVSGNEITPLGANYLLQGLHLRKSRYGNLLTDCFLSGNKMSFKNQEDF